MCGTDELQELVRVLADVGLGVVAGDVVPFDSVLVDVVEDSHASFNRFIDLEFGVVGLGNVAALELSLVAGVGPGLVGPARGRGVGGGHLDAGSGPEPSIDDGGLEVFTVTPLEVAETAAGPDVGKVLFLDESSDEHIFGWGFERDEVHAVLAANVSALQPIDLVVLVGIDPSGVKVSVTVVSEVDWSICAFLYIGKCEKSSGCILRCDLWCRRRSCRSRQIHAVDNYDSGNETANDYVTYEFLHGDVGVVSVHTHN